MSSESHFPYIIPWFLFLPNSQLHFSLTLHCGTYLYLQVSIERLAYLEKHVFSGVGADYNFSPLNKKWVLTHEYKNPFIRKCFVRSSSGQMFWQKIAQHIWNVLRSSKLPDNHELLALELSLSPLPTTPALTHISVTSLIQPHPSLWSSSPSELLLGIWLLFVRFFFYLNF